MTQRKLKPETIEKLEWLKGRLRKYPHRYDQNRTCGTQACLYGYCLPRMLGKRLVTMRNVLGTITSIDDWNPIRDWSKWLGVSSLSADKLFTADWSGKAAQFNRLASDTDKQAAEKACQRIDLFIESGGAL